MTATVTATAVPSRSLTVTGLHGESVAPPDWMVEARAEAPLSAWWQVYLVETGMRARIHYAHPARHLVTSVDGLVWDDGDGRLCTRTGSERWTFWSARTGQAVQEVRG